MSNNYHDMEQMEQDTKEEHVVIYGKKLPKQPKTNIFKYIFFLILLIVILYLIIYYYNLFGLFISHKRLVLLGYGAVGRSVFPILLDKFPFIKEYIIIDKRKIELNEFPEHSSDINIQIVHKEGLNYKTLKKGIQPYIKDNDIVIALYGCAETFEILKALLGHKNIIYADASLENDELNELNESSTQADLYFQFSEFVKKYKPTITGSYDAGANPGLITHFAIMGIYSMAKSAIKRKIKDYKLIERYLLEKNLPMLAQILQVDTIHISEMETIEPSDPSKYDYTKYISNTWSVDSFLEEWNINSEVSTGTQDYEYFVKEKNLKQMTNLFPPFTVLPYPLYSYTAGPFGKFTGKNVRHPETIEISNIFSNKDHVPTVAFVYHPSRIPRQSLENKNWKTMPYKIIDELSGGPLRGNETMGATLISSREDVPARWYGSVVTCQQSRDLNITTNPTTLQVAAGIYSHLKYALKNENHILGPPHLMNTEQIIEYAKPYIGTIWDIDLQERLPTKFKELLSTKENMDYDLIKTKENRNGN